MKSKEFLMNFKAVVNIAGTVQIKADNEAHARLKTAEIIRQALEQEDCIIELELKNKNDVNITIKEITNHRNLNITNIMPLN